MMTEDCDGNDEVAEGNGLELSLLVFVVVIGILSALELVVMMVDEVINALEVLVVVNGACGGVVVVIGCDRDRGIEVVVLVMMTAVVVGIMLELVPAGGSSGGNLSSG